MIRLRSVCFLYRRLPLNQCFCESKQPLFSSSSLGIDKFLMEKKKKLENFQDINTFKAHVENLCKNENSLVFVYDLVRMVTAVSSSEDVELLYNLLEKYGRQRQLVLLKNYRFGIDVLKLLYVMNEPDVAIKLVKHEVIAPYFHFHDCAKIVLYLLFKNQRYDDVLRMYEYYVRKSVIHLHSRNHLVICYGACYKLNSPESFNKALAHFKGFLYYTPRHRPLRISLLFAALAVKQNQPLCAVECLFGSKEPLVLNVMCMAYAQANRLEECFVILWDALRENNPKDFFVIEEVISFIESKIQEDNSLEDYDVQLKNLKEHLISNNKIRKEIYDEPVAKRSRKVCLPSSFISYCFTFRPKPKGEKSEVQILGSVF